MSEPTLAERLLGDAYLIDVGERVDVSTDDMRKASRAIEKCQTAFRKSEARRLALDQPCELCLRLDHAPDCAWAEALEAMR